MTKYVGDCDKLTRDCSDVRSDDQEIFHPSQLNSLSSLPFLHRTGLGKIVLSETFQHPNKEQWEQNLNRNYYACGCIQSAKALTIGLLIFGVVGVLGFNNYGWSIAKTIITIFVGSIAMGILGKLFTVSLETAFDRIPNNRLWLISKCE
jgi:putative Mn2+ efflux pump MntP